MSADTCLIPAVINLLIATRNRHKVAEIQSILGPAFRCQPLAELSNAPEVVEDAPTFAGNATKKATELARWIAGKAELNFVLADDSGLEVDALGGQPGVHSARFAALDANPADQTQNSPDAENNAKLLRLLQNVPAKQRTARFHCVIALVEVRPPGSGNPQVQLFDGTCEGRIDFAPRGSGGFGYDPLFIPNGYEQSFAELGEAAKNQLSHRAQALAKLGIWLSCK